MSDLYYRQIIRRIEDIKPLDAKTSFIHAAHYVGTPHVFLGLSTLETRRIAKDFHKENLGLSYESWLAVLDNLYSSKSYEQKIIASEILSIYKEYISKISFKFVDKWINYLAGWAEIDVLCQNRFKYEDFLARPKAREDFIRKLNKSSNISKRRASLVLLVALGRHSKTADKRLHRLGYEMIENVKIEKDILITKSVSWLLRAMSEKDPEGVKNYINENLDSLPSIAIRETISKIETGKKYVRGKRSRS